MTKKCTDTMGWKRAQEKRNATLKERKEQRINQYNEAPALCKHCNKPIEYERRINDFCGRSCSGSFNNILFPKRTRKEQIAYKSKSRRFSGKFSRTIYELGCKYCQIDFYSCNPLRKFCSNGCSKKFQISERDRKRKDAALSGKASHKTIRDYLIKINGPICAVCRWSEINPTTKKVPIELDHIDGNSDHNTIENARLICPNCHSLTPTYKGANRGKGRHKRKQRYHDGKSY